MQAANIAGKAFNRRSSITPKEEVEFVFYLKRQSGHRESGLNQLSGN
jgi:hypothetical protein